MNSMIRAYGDTVNDGKIQLSFTLPVPHSLKAREAARQYVLHLGFSECEIVHAAPLSDDFTFFIAYAKSEVDIDFDLVETESAREHVMDFDEINDFIRREIGRRIAIVGACTGTDAHTVGIDAIMNMKGYNHHFGLERYPMIDAFNLGAQVPNQELVDFAETKQADAILVSQVVSEKGKYLSNLMDFVKILTERGFREKVIILLGGPRITNSIALELGFDAGFGKGTFAEHAASYIIQKLAV